MVGTWRGGGTPSYPGWSTQAPISQRWSTWGPVLGEEEGSSSLSPPSPLLSSACNRAKQSLRFLCRIQGQIRYVLGQGWVDLGLQGWKWVAGRFATSPLGVRCHLGTCGLGRSLCVLVAAQPSLDTSRESRPPSGVPAAQPSAAGDSAGTGRGVCLEESEQPGSPSLCSLSPEQEEEEDGFHPLPGLGANLAAAGEPG